jgi:hypothetical protein
MRGYNKIEKRKGYDLDLIVTIRSSQVQLNCRTTISELLSRFIRTSITWQYDILYINTSFPTEKLKSTPPCSAFFRLPGAAHRPGVASGQDPRVRVILKRCDFSSLLAGSFVGDREKLAARVNHRPRRRRCREFSVVVIPDGGREWLRVPARGWTNDHGVRTIVYPFSQQTRKFARALHTCTGFLKFGSLL